jgi:hypothetical protein
MEYMAVLREGGHDGALTLLTETNPGRLLDGFAPASRPAGPVRPFRCWIDCCADERAREGNNCAAGGSTMGRPAGVSFAMDGIMERKAPARRGDTPLTPVD